MIRSIVARRIGRNATRRDPGLAGRESMMCDPFIRRLITGCSGRSAARSAAEPGRYVREKREVMDLASLIPEGVGQTTEFKKSLSAYP